MKLFAMALLSGAFAAASLGCARGEACREVTVESNVEIGVEVGAETEIESGEAEPGRLTLADLLGRGACPQLRAAAARVQLGAVPRAGSVRVLDGGEVRRRFEKLERESLSPGKMGLGKMNPEKISLEKTGTMAIPERIVVRRGGPTKSCAEIARYVGGSAAAEEMAALASGWREELDCAGARGIPEEAPLEMGKSGWNAALERWEFALHCARPGDCIPFMVWVPGSKKAIAAMALRQGEARRGASASGEFPLGLGDGANGAQRLVKAGQTAILTWDEAGIRVVLPVTCLDAGGLGQFVRVRLKNAARIMRAEVVGQATLRAIL
jgi:hypothetical protein